MMQEFCPPTHQDVLVVIPTFNNQGTIARVVNDVLALGLPVLVVNDGCTDNTASILASLPVEVLSHSPNKGKGYALRQALKYAVDKSYCYMITIDADAQHYASDIPNFLAEIARTPGNLLVGARNLTAENMPSKNTFANKFSNFWFLVETGQKMVDTQSGFRLYPVEKLKNMRFITPGYEFEVEVLVRAAWKEIPVRNIPIQVYYPSQEERVSHFKPVKDFTRISILNTFLVIIAFLFYYPWRFLQLFTKENIRQFVARNITRSPHSNLRLSSAIGLGVFFGIVPLWGFQMISAGFSAHFLKLNKVLTIISANISIPPLIPFILYGSYFIGGKLLGREINIVFSDITIERATGDLIQYIVGSVLLAIISGVISFVVSFLIMTICKRKAAHE